MGDAKAIYPTVDYAYSSVPTYPDGQIGYIIATKNKSNDFLRYPKRAVPAEMKSVLRYYNEEVHKSAFILPAFAANKLENVRAPQTLTSSNVPAYIICALGIAVGTAIALLKK